jgi:hypothetical protein
MKDRAVVKTTLNILQEVINRLGRLRRIQIHHKTTLISFELDAWLCVRCAGGKQKDASKGDYYCSVRAKRGGAHGCS